MDMFAIATFAVLCLTVRRTPHKKFEGGVSESNGYDLRVCPSVCFLSRWDPNSLGSRIQRTLIPGMSMGKYYWFQDGVEPPTYRSKSIALPNELLRVCPSVSRECRGRLSDSLETCPRSKKITESNEGSQ